MEPKPKPKKKRAPAKNKPKTAAAAPRTADTKDIATEIRALEAKLDQIISSPTLPDSGPASEPLPV